jgi:mannosyl-oligosaccharide alpha-1,2-mannosidase
MKVSQDYLVSISEATTLQLEFKYLTYLTDDPKYWNSVQLIMKKVLFQSIIQVFQLKRTDGLVRIFLNCNTGKFEGELIRLGSRGDSYYGYLYIILEYLAKQWVQTNYTESIYENEWRTAVTGIRKHLLGVSKPNGFLFLGELADGIQGSLSEKMDHLVCFLPGTLALAATRGKQVMKKNRNNLHPRDLQDLEVILVYSFYSLRRN